MPLDILNYRAEPTPGPPRQVAARRGLVVEEPLTGWVGAIVRADKMAGGAIVILEDRVGKTRSFPLGDEFWIDGEPVRLTLRPSAAATAPGGQSAAAGPRRTASGSIADPNARARRARTARGSRLWVEGRHDAELIEKVWGDDLREAGVVVELLDGVDNLAVHLREFAPTAQRRVGVLVDHLVAGTKETRLVAAAVATAPPGTVLARGHQFVDVWQAVKAESLGWRRWPVVPRGIEWKVGILTALGWPSATQADIAAGWHRILGAVRDFRDLDPSLLGPVEELIDFVTVD